MEEKKTEGLLLQSIPYLGNQKILKVLTKEKGLLSFIVKKKGLSQIADPFMTAEWIYTSKGKDIHPLKDLSPTYLFEEIRNSFLTIEIAGKIGKALLLTQKPENSSTGVYLLTIAYLRKLSSFENPKNLLSSFYLKVLLHEGLLGLESHCECGEIATFLGPEGSQCTAHQKLGSLPFSLEEIKTLEILTFSRKFTSLQEVNLSNQLSEKIETLFFIFL